MRFLSCALPVILAAVFGEAAVLFTPNPLAPVYDGSDLSGRDDPACEIKLAGARGGAFSGQTVIWSAAPGPGPAAKASDLKSADGASVIPASAVEIRYALPTGANGNERLPAGMTGVFDALAPAPRQTGTVHVVWVTVAVPRNAAPGEYTGRLSVADREMPLRIRVADWTLPLPVDYATWVDFVQSPESVALRYGRKLWSDEHWQLVSGSFEQLGKVGNKTLYIPLMAQTHFGNSESMVRWILKDGHTLQGGEKGAPRFTHDFSIAEKYLDLFLKHVGKPRIVVFYIYEGFLGGSQGRNAEECGRGVPFTLLDPRTGATTNAAGPTHNNANPAYPNYPDDTIAFWKPVIDGMRERLNARGVGDETITLGMSPDLSPGKLQMEYLAKTFPYARWCKQGHGLQAGKMGPMPMGYNTTVWQAMFARTPSDRLYGWKQYPIPVAMFDRDIFKTAFRMQLVRSRLLGEMNITGKQRGFGRMSADFWPCVRNEKGHLYSIVNRYPLSNWAQLTLRMTPYLYPGADGALSTVRFEMLREGVQECEARIFIEKALLSPASRARMGDERAARIQALLDERVGAILDSMKKAGDKAKAAGGVQETSAEFADGPWQERSAKLYAAAAEVAAALSVIPGQKEE